MSEGRLGEIQTSLLAKSRLFRRSLHIRHIDTGSDGAVESEIQALTNPYYDLNRLGFFFTPSPRHADIVLVTGAVTREMEIPLRRTLDLVPEPRAVVAAGTAACGGGLESGARVLGGVDRVVPVDVWVPGDPPSPLSLLHALLLAVDRVEQKLQHQRRPAGGGRP